MIRRWFQGPALLCFSPPVMAATLIVEAGLAVWIVTRFALSTSRRLILLILICLAGFQLAEFQVCSGSPANADWSRLGYVLITLLPALGYDLVLRLWNYQTRWRWAAYVIAGSFMAILGLWPAAISSGICTGNYVIFQVAEPLNGFWTFYYVSFVLGAMAMATAGGWFGPSRTRQALMWLARGYAAFVVPSYLIYWLAPRTSVGLPSIMCGFAIVLAVILAFKVAPAATDSTRKR